MPSLVCKLFSSFFLKKYRTDEMLIEISERLIKLPIKRLKVALSDYAFSL
jgi:hypothetical protein